MNRTHFGKAARPGVPQSAAPAVDGVARAGTMPGRRHDAGKLAFGFGTEGIDCTIVDISDFGAHVVGHLERSTIPRTLFLIHLKNRVAYECQVSWIEDDRLGLKFLKQHDLRNPETSELKAMGDQCCGP